MWAFERYIGLGSRPPGPGFRGVQKLHKIFCHFWTALNPCPGGLDPSSIYHWKAHKLLYIHHISDLPDAQLTCLRSVTYATITTFIIGVEFKISPGRSVKAMTHSMLNLKFLLESNEQKPTRNKEKTLLFERNFIFNSCQCKSASICKVNGPSVRHGTSMN